MILSGDIAATVLAAQEVSLHGQRMVDIVYAHDDEPGTARRMRLPSEETYAGLGAEDKVLVRYLINVPMGVTRRAEGEA